ncbi:hypothetical protein OOK27_05150 [Streptomyces canus]|uniref:hypothetical protein n=1 Tax=Streptomyces canus TaxID=58343 RepID=UPI0022574A61|nr:hypothetical protein [Streptomyces canus]MCX5253559.1 hypothetical protein [Streptomyces canus]
MTANRERIRLRQQLIRQLEGHLRKSIAITDIRRQLTQTGMPADEIWAIELPIRRRIREERAGRKEAA